MEELEGVTAEEALARAVWALYAVEPAEFVAARKQWVTLVRTAGHKEVAKEVGALRKPSVSAAAVNALVRAEDPVVGRLKDVGAKMRHAQSALDAKGMAALRGDRDALLRDWVTAAREHAPDGTLTSAVEAEVRDTAVAALADAEATEVVTSGSLTRALSYSGFGEVDVADAVARTSTGVVLTRIEGSGGVVEDEPEPEPEVDEPEPEEDEPEPEPEEDEAEEDEPEEDEAEEDEPEEAEADEHEPEEEPDDTARAERVAELEMALDEAEKAVAAARAARKEAAEAQTRAEREATVAQKQVAQAERLLAGARTQLEKAEAAQEKAAGVLEAAEEELSSSRTQRDAARAALEEAEDG